MIGTAHDSQLAERINYAALLGGTGAPAARTAPPGSELPGQMTIDEALASDQEDQ
jgi:hypothetical protein